MVLSYSTCVRRSSGDPTAAAPQSKAPGVCSSGSPPRLPALPPVPTVPAAPEPPLPPLSLLSPPLAAVPPLPPLEPPEPDGELVVSPEPASLPPPPEPSAAAAFDEPPAAASAFEDLVVSPHPTTPETVTRAPT